MTRIIFIILLQAGLTIAGLWGQAQKNVTLVGQLTYNDELNDIWGYVDGTGKEYALVGLVNGISIVDLSDPTQPTELHRIPGVKSDWRDLKTFGSYAYISNETDSGLTIVDLSGLPGNISYKDTVMGGITQAHNVFVDENGILYVIGYNDAGGFKMFDLNADPWHPQLAGDYNQNYVHDMYARGGLAYSSELSTGLVVVDVNDPASPQILGSRDYPGAFTHNTWLSDDGSVCITTDEISAGYLTAWDVTDPSNIQFLDHIRSSVNDEHSAPHNAHVFNDYIVTSYYADGLHITDAARPGNLIEVGYYDTSPIADGTFNGAWGAYPFLPSGLILVSDIQEGLFILQPGYRRGCYLEGEITDAETMAPISNVEVLIAEDTISEFSRTAGDYAIGVADSGAYTVIFEKYGYESDTISVVLDNGLLTVRDIALTPLPRTALKIMVLDSQTLAPIPQAQILALAPDNKTIFEYTSGFNGQIFDSRFVINTYQLIIGKWGYITRDSTLLIEPGSDSLVIYLNPGHYDDFALDFGWEVVGTAERGVWERGEPVGTYRETGEIYNPEFDLSDDIGDNAYVTGNSGGSPFGDDVDNGYTMLISPPVNLSGYTSPVLQYHWWFLNWSLNGSAPDGPGNDFLTVSVTDGLDTVELRRYTGPYDTTWNAEIAVPFTKSIDSTREVKFIFYTQDLEPGNQDAVEAGIDGFRIVEASSVSLEEFDIQEIGFHPFPNPAREFLSIQYELPASFQGSSWRISLKNIYGQTMLHQPVINPSGEIRLNLPYPAGVYFLNLIHQDQVLLSRKIILNQY